MTVSLVRPRAVTTSCCRPAHLVILAVSAVFFGAAIQGHAQTAAGNLIDNPGFEQTYPLPNWDGVDQDGFLAMNTESLTAITESGSVSPISMPVSVRVADLNADGLQDVFAADPEGYFRIYFNSGSPTAPQFTHGEVVPLFISRVGTGAFNATNDLRRAPRIDLYDFRRQGLLDLVIGTYGGEVFLIPNTGGKSAPEFRQPTDVNRARVQTASGDRLWGNLFAPAVHDFDGDGNPDLLLGEGSYSANSVHLLMNKGSGQSPKYTAEDRYFLAYGDGREHLVPALADFNGDGQLDLLVGDRGGTVAVHLNPGAGWKPGTEFPFSSLISFGGSTSLGGSICPAVGDLNGDGLVDLLVGKGNGRIALALNTGSAKEPKYSKPAEIKGRRLYPPATAPTGWSVDFGYRRGNLLGQVTCADAAQDPQVEAPEGKRALRVSYVPSPNRIVKLSPLILPSTGKMESFFRWNRGLKTMDAGVRAHGGASNFFVLAQDLRNKLKNGSTYELSFKAKGSRIQNAEWTVAWSANISVVASKVVRGERGSVQREGGQRAAESEEQRAAFSVSPTWSTVSRKFPVKLSEQELKETNPSNALLVIECLVAPGEGVLYLDDFKLVEAK